MARPLDSEIAWGNFKRQHSEDINMEAFVKSLYAPLDSLGQALEAMKSLTDINQASGQRLDLIGSIVGADRYLPQGITLAFFGFISQPSGRGFGKARMRSQNEGTTESYTAADAEFKTLIRTKIALNNGHGTAPEIEAAAKLAFNAPVVSARDAGDASIDLWVGRIPSVDEGLGRVLPDYLPRAAGVSVNIIFWEPSLPFGFSNNKHFGFGVGVLARSPLS
jgi:hypothetical protein